MAGAEYPEEMFHILTGQPSGSGLTDAFSKDGHEYAIKLFRYWGETLGAKIQKHAFEFDPNEIANPAPTTAP
jgi:hypothetical protein